MKLRLQALLITGMFALVATMLPLSAAIAHGQTDDGEEATTTAVETEKPDPAALKARIDERKAALKVRLDAAKQARIKTRCKTAQGSISNIRGRIKGLETSRANVYENLLDRLTKLNERLKTHDVNTTEFEAQLEELHTLIDTFSTDLAAYKQAVGDLADMDCVSDPAGFQASLEAARTARTKAADSAKAIRTYLTETIKPTLSELKAQFAQNSGEDKTEQETENEGGEQE